MDGLWPLGKNTFPLKGNRNLFSDRSVVVFNFGPRAIMRTLLSYIQPAL